jgi:hypothetical protein
MKPQKVQKEFHGDAIKRVLARAGVSYQEAADRLNHNGFAREGGKPYDKPYIANLALNRQPTPDTFVEQLADLLGLPPGWQISQETPSSSTDVRIPFSLSDGGLVRALDVPYLPMPSNQGGLRNVLERLANWTKRMPVPSFLASTEVVAVPIENSAYFKAGWRRGDVLVLLPNQLPRFDKIYAVTMADGGAGAFMKAVEGEDGEMVFRSIDGSVFTSDELFVDAIVLCRLPQYRPGKNAGFFDEDGLEIANW